MMWFFGALWLWMAQAVHSIQNSTNIVTLNDGWSVYPCYQVNYRVPEFETSLLGLWYVIEIIEHMGNPSIRDVHVSAKCPKVNLYKTASEVKLNWQDKDGDIHYVFRMTDPENEGFWMALNRQTGSLLEKKHRSFHGTVQILEAEPSRMVLTFCSFNNSHYSIIMVRNISIVHDTIATRQRISNFGLAEKRVTQTCNDAQGSAPYALTSIALLLASSLVPFYSINN